ncbi:winged helix-turn-helix transcriptional regulator [Candidatus Leptofilum sp.]|uniref:winged helix-turn-helix transcriptional regulator n=1 Tax=Candidatus Leptofilum sp. TaxID=3241576 RepID=UPI003B5A7435
MYKYGQYCPIAKAVEILGDRWTLLIVRDLLTGTRHFNNLERGLPGISRGLLAERLRRLQRMGLVEKVAVANGRQRTAYYLTEAGQELHTVIDSLLVWGARWAFEEPEENELDPVLLMWWMRGRVRRETLPAGQTVVRFDFEGAKYETFWLLLKREDVSICLTDPGFDLDVLVTADLSAFFQIWLGRLTFAEAQRAKLVQVDGIPTLVEALPTWFSYSLASPAVRAAQKSQND